MKTPQTIYVLTIDGITMPDAFTTISALCLAYPIVKVTPARASLHASGLFLFSITEDSKPKICTVSKLSIQKLKRGDITRMSKVP
jgi:hypothetical protein